MGKQDLPPSSSDAVSAAVPLEDLTRSVQGAWSRDTSISPEAWSTERPWVGQCAVTALVIQDRCGGDLLRAEVAGVSHYWNRLPDGSEVDLTRMQFDSFVVDGPIQVRDRGYVLSFPDTVTRYERLLSAINEEISG